MPTQKTIAMVFDFDQTLAPDSTSGFLENIGVDVRRFWRAHKLLITKESWDPIPAYLHMIIEESQRRSVKKKITQAKLKAWGKKMPLYPGVSALFSRARRQVKAINPDLSVEFYVISSGIGEILRASRIAKYFTDIWASDFSLNAKGEIQAMKNVVSFTDKTRFLFQIQKGIIGPRARKEPFAVNEKFPPEKIRIPLDHMIVIGDGFTDIPCFSLVQKNNGVAIGVYDRASRDRWGKAWGFIKNQRVTHMVAADYRKHSGLDDAISMALDKIGKNITLRGITYPG